MNIEYDVNLYKEMANFSVNEIVNIKNRKGINRTIHITNITKITWQELQLLVPGRANRFTRMVYLYKLLLESEINRDTIKGNVLSSREKKEIEEYIKIYRDYGCKKHDEVNEIITRENLWGDFKKIRSLNDHGVHKGIKGIQPNYFEIVCNILNISGGSGLPLTRYTIY